MAAANLNGCSATYALRLYGTVLFPGGNAVG